MQEHQDPDNGASTEAPDDEQLDALLEDIDEELDDDLDESVGPYGVEQFDTASLMESEDLLVDELADLEPLGAEVVEVDEEDDEDEDDEGDDLLDDFALAPGIAQVGTAEPSSLEERIARLETAASALAEAEQTRESRKIKRKVTASATGAGAAGFIPILLELLGVFNLDPEVAATAAAAAAALGSFAIGYLTPERTPPLPDAEAQALLDLGRATPGS